MIRFRVGIFTVDFFIPDTFSLKDKRSVMRRIVGKARGSRRGFNISIAEVDAQDSIRRGVLSASVTSPDLDHIYKIFGVLTTFFESFNEIEITSIKTEVLSFNYNQGDISLEEKYGC